jgi:bifunctional UDP-N-acetylglucosamine pyrophosphorylase/glucosamine-1-phosphate N-acetyltransferase
VPDFNEWRGGFQNYSRVIRDDAGKIIRTVEYKDATEAEREIKEVNPCYFVFDKDWLFNKIKTLSKENAQGEYYLTDLIKIAFQEGAQIETVPISPIEAMGANSKEQLEMLELLFDAR